MMLAFFVALALMDDPPSNLPNDPQSIRMRIDHNMRAAEEQLRRQNIEDKARKLQEEILRDIDRLLALTKESPPQKNDQKDQSQSNPPSNPPPDAKQGSTKDKEPDAGKESVGGSGQRGKEPRDSQAQPRPGGGSAEGQPRSTDQPSRGTGSRGESRRERRAQSGRSNTATAKGQSSNPSPGDEQRAGPTGSRPGESKGQAGTNPSNARGATMNPDKNSPPPARLADMNRDVWGHLPPTLRQEVDHYYRDRFMPRYQELLQQYYSQLAESKRTEQERK